MWFDKQDARAVYLDRREEVIECHKKENDWTITIAPDVLGDFTELPFPDESFYHVVFDPPHHTSARLGSGGNSNAQKYYGILLPGWEEMLQAGFAECFRVLKHGGTLVFKWGSVEIPLERVLALTPEKPMYGHKSGKLATTHWVAFLKQNV